MLNDTDKQLVTELGLGELPEAQQIEQLQKFYETLEIRVGMQLESQLSDEQLAEFDMVHKSGNEAEAVAWLEKAVPEYTSIVQAETEALKQEIMQTAAEVRDIIRDKDLG